MDFIMMFDRQYSNEGFICISSLIKVAPKSKIFVLCLELEVERMLKEIEQVVPIHRTDLEAYFPDIAATRPLRPWAPYTQSLKPFIPEYIFDTYVVDSLTYVDSDMFFWGDTKGIEEELEGYAFMVASREQDPPPPGGYFNGGFFSCYNNQDCRDFLKWWQEKCIDWCLWEIGPEGRFTEEGYLNIFKTEPQKFKGIKICGHPGVNLAPWNVGKHRVEQVDEGFLVDGLPLICYHYQGFNRNDIFEPPRFIPLEIGEPLYHPYFNFLTERVLKKTLAKAIEDAELFRFQTVDEDIILKITLFKNVPQDLQDGSIQFNFSFKKNPTKKCVLITQNEIAVGFFVPRVWEGNYGMPIFIAPQHRNKGIGKRVIRMYMTGKRGKVFIASDNISCKKAFASCGFSLNEYLTKELGNEMFGVWTNQEL